MARGARRVLVTLSWESGALARLEAAVALAADLNAELTALFVEDIGLLRASRLPGARELGRLTARPSLLQAADVERMFKAAADKAEARLRQAAADRAIRFTFEVARDVAGRALLAQTEHVDALLTGPGARRGAASSLSGRPVVVLYEGSAASGQALEAAGGLSLALGVPCLALIPARDIAEYATKLAHARTLFGGMGLAGERIEPGDGASLAARVNRLRASLLVLRDDPLGRGAQWLDTLMAHLDTDLLLLR